MDVHTLPEADPSWAWFLDVDGTLIEIAHHPDAVSVGARVLSTIETLARAASGALALISGRAIADLDRLFTPLHLPCAGQHGLERRDAAGRVHIAGGPSPALDFVRGELARFATRYPGTHVEDKGLAVALHFRSAPHAADAALALGRDIARRYGDTLAIQPGKMVLEFRSPGADKGAAIAAFMAEAPFSGRRPVFVGDDVTDEAGFAEINRRGGISVRIGAGPPTAARWRLADVAALIDWMSGESGARATRARGGGL
jgi:trehalose 6-phosphate phosphatase